jgi:hypothetical protein
VPQAAVVGGPHGLVARERNDVRAIDEFHRDEALKVVSKEIIEADDVRVAKVREKPKFALQPIEVVGTRGVERFQRDLPTVRRVDRAVHNPTAALPQLL